LRNEQNWNKKDQILAKIEKKVQKGSG